MNPNKVNPTSASLVRALRGPVLMIAVGALFAAEYSGGPGFSRTWPVLVILVGLFKLIEYMGAQKA